MLSACRKDAVKKTADKSKTPVTFALGFTQSTGGFNGAANITKGKFGPHTLAMDTSLTKYASVIYIGVYASDGTQLFLTKQLATDTAFGKVNYNLSPGSYTVTFSAGQSGMVEGGTTLANTDFYYPVGPSYHPYIWKNSFFKKISLTVGNASINQSVTLSRIDAQVIVNIEDAVPANVKFIFFSISDEQGGYTVQQLFDTNTGGPYPGTATGYEFANTSLDTALIAGTKNIKLMIPLLASNRKFDINIVAYDRLPPAGFQGSTFGENIVASYSTSNVTIQNGHQTILSGKLFGGNGLSNTGGFQITVDPQWGTTTTTIPFQ